MAKKSANPSQAAAVPYLAGAAGTVLAVVVALGAWLALALIVDATRRGGVSVELLRRAGLILAVGAMIVTPVAYVLGIPAAAALEWALRRTDPTRLTRARYASYLLAGLVGGGALAPFLGTVPAEAVLIVMLGGGAAVAGAATMRLADQRPVLARRLALGVPVALAVVALLAPGG